METPSDWKSWQHAFTATFFISMLPNVLLFLIPSHYLIKVGRYNVHHIMLCFAAGGLLGDVFLHTIPHLLDSHDENHNQNLGHGNHEYHDHHDQHEHHHDHHDHNHDHHSHKDHDHHHDNGHHDDHDDHDHTRATTIGVMIMLGFLLFLMTEKIVNIQMKKWRTGKTKKSDDESEASISHGHGHSHDDVTQLSAAGWLNLVADSMHNFTDGIAIGASFAGGKGLAMATTISVLMHEIPHEIGDFTILIESGFSKWAAIRAQFATAVAAFLGTLVGLVAERNKSVEEALLAITAGGFVYVATVSVLPLVVTESTGGLLQAGLEAAAFATGVAFMVAVAQLEAHDH